MEVEGGEKEEEEGGMLPAAVATVSPVSRLLLGGSAELERSREGPGGRGCSLPRSVLLWHRVPRTPSEEVDSAAG